MIHKLCRTLGIQNVPLQHSTNEMSEVIDVVNAYESEVAKVRCVGTAVQDADNQTTLFKDLEEAACKVTDRVLHLADTLFAALGPTEQARALVAAADEAKVLGTGVIRHCATLGIPQQLPIVH